MFLIGWLVGFLMGWVAMYYYPTVKSMIETKLKRG